MRRTLHLLLLALSLLMLSWYQLGHELTAHAGQAAPDCEICVFSGNLGHGATPVIASVAALPVQAHYIAPVYISPTLALPFLAALSERGPPTLSLT